MRDVTLKGQNSTRNLQFLSFSSTSTRMCRVAFYRSDLLIPIIPIPFLAYRLGGLGAGGFAMASLRIVRLCDTSSVTSGSSPTFLFSSLICVARPGLLAANAFWGLSRERHFLNKFNVCTRGRRAEASLRDESVQSCACSLFSFFSLPWSAVGNVS